MADAKNAKKYDIGTHRFMQLYYHCLQYNEWKEELKVKCDTLHSSSIHEVSAVYNSDVTQRLAMRRAELSRKCELIEQTAIEADSEIYQYILKAVTNEGITYNYLKMVCNIPCGKDMYYDRRKKFYWLLDKKV